MSRVENDSRECFSNAMNTRETVLENSKVNMDR